MKTFYPEKDSFKKYDITKKQGQEIYSRLFDNLKEIPFYFKPIYIHKGC